MSTQDDRWLWFIDDGPLQVLLSAEEDPGTMRMRAASSPALVRAMTHHLEGRTGEAARELRAAIEAGERQPEIFLLLGQMQFESHQLEEAAATFRELHTMDGAHAIAAFNAGVCLEMLARWKEADDSFRAALDADPERCQAWLGLGLCSLHQRRPEEALASFDRYLETDAHSEQGQFGRAVALQMLHRYDDAAAIYDRFVAAGEPTPELMTNLLSLAVARRDNDALARIAKELNRLRPSSRQAVEALAYAAVSSGEWESALTHLAQLTAPDASPGDWGYAEAYALWKLNRVESSELALDEFLKSHSDHPGALLLRGVLLEEAGRADEALAAYCRAGNLSSDADSALWNAARLAAASGKAALCAQVAKTLLDRNGESPEGWFASGLASLGEERPKEAVKAFAAALRLRGEWPEAEWNLGLSQLDSGDPARAEKSLERARMSLQGRVRAELLARAALANGHPERAFAVLDDADELGACPDLVFNIALAFQETGAFDSAERLYRRLTGPGTQFADAQVNLGHVLLATGRPEEAEEAWRQAADWETELAAASS